MTTPTQITPASEPMLAKALSLRADKEVIAAIKAAIAEARLAGFEEARGRAVEICEQRAGYDRKPSYQDETNLLAQDLAEEISHMEMEED